MAARAAHASVRRPVLVLLLLTAAAAAGRGDVALEETGRVESLTQPPHPHWVWIGDPIVRRSALVDLDTGAMLGSVGGGEGIPAPLAPRSRPELYMPATYYARGDHGPRTDVLVIYDSVRLMPVAEVVLPPKRAIPAFVSGTAALSDDDRFAALFNLTPATSLSIVDLEQRELAAEVPTPGCSLVYAAGPRRFLSICGNGALLVLTLDDAGKLAERRRTAPFFDPIADPVTEKAVRWGDTWLFVSFEGIVHSVDVSGAELEFPAAWSLLSDADREASWRIGGTRHLAVHADTGRLYALVHRGGVDTHKDPGTEVWVYDLGTRERVQRIVLTSPGVTFMGVPIELGEGWIWPFDRLAGWALSQIPLGIDEIAVTQDEQPLLVTVSAASGGLGLYDARSGAFTRRVYSGNLANLGLVVPAGWAQANRGMP